MVITCANLEVKNVIHFEIAPKCHKILSKFWYGMISQIFFPVVIFLLFLCLPVCDIDELSCLSRICQLGLCFPRSRSEPKFCVGGRTWSWQSGWDWALSCSFTSSPPSDVVALPGQNVFENATFCAFYIFLLKIAQHSRTFRATTNQSGSLKSR